MILVLIGLISGIAGGMGMGGGAILIPALVLFISPRQHIAQSVNLLFFIPTAVVALLVHAGNKRIDIRTALPIIISGMAGAALGSSLAVSIPGPELRRLFGIFLFIMGIYELGGREGRQESL